MLGEFLCCFIWHLCVTLCEVDFANQQTGLNYSHLAFPVTYQPTYTFKFPYLWGADSSWYISPGLFYEWSLVCQSVEVKCHMVHFHFPLTGLEWPLKLVLELAKVKAWVEAEWTGWPVAFTFKQPAIQNIQYCTRGMVWLDNESPRTSRDQADFCPPLISQSCCFLCCADF